MTKKESVANLKQIVQDESSSTTEKLLATSLIDVYHRIGKLGGNDQWCAGLIDENAIGFVDDGEAQPRQEQPAGARLLGVQPLGQQLKDLPLAFGQRGIRHALGHEQCGGQRRVHEGVAVAHRADRADQILGRRALHHVSAGPGRDRVRRLI